MNITADNFGPRCLLATVGRDVRAIVKLSVVDPADPLAQLDYARGTGRVWATLHLGHLGTGTVNIRF